MLIQQSGGQLKSNGCVLWLREISLSFHKTVITLDGINFYMYGMEVGRQHENNLYQYSAIEEKDIYLGMNC